MTAKPPQRQKGPCRTCRFSHLAATGILECREGPPTPVAVEIKDGKVIGSNGVNYLYSRMDINHDGCWRYVHTAEKKFLPDA